MQDAQAVLVGARRSYRKEGVAVHRLSPDWSAEDTGDGRARTVSGPLGARLCPAHEVSPDAGPHDSPPGRALRRGTQRGPGVLVATYTTVTPCPRRPAFLVRGQDGAPACRPRPSAGGDSRTSLSAAGGEGHGVALARPSAGLGPSPGVTAVGRSREGRRGALPALRVPVSEL